MPDPFIILLNNRVDCDQFALALIKKKKEDLFFSIHTDDDELLSYYIDMNGSGLFIGRHGYTGMGDFYSGTHGNTGMGFF